MIHHMRRCRDLVQQRGLLIIAEYFDLRFGL